MITDLHKAVGSVDMMALLRVKPPHTTDKTVIPKSQPLPAPQLTRDAFGKKFFIPKKKPSIFHILVKISAGKSYQNGEGKSRGNMLYF